MKESLWAFVFSLVLAATANAQQPALPTATNSVGTNSVSNFEETRAKAEKGDVAAQRLARQFKPRKAAE
jgi:hypothetical protein